MKKIFVLLLLVLSLGFVSCTSEINISLNQNGTIDVHFQGTSGIAFSTLIRSASGVNEGEVVFDTNEISYELAKNGFTAVNVNSKTGTDLSISMKDEAKTSSLYTSGVLTNDKNNLTAVLSAQKLLNFYNASDEELVTFLDMLLAPIFNNEVLSEAEYLDTIAVFYGEEAAKEIGESNFRIVLSAPDGRKSTHIIPMSKLLTLNETLILSL